MTRVLTLTGADGSGKTTVCAALAKELGARVRVVSPWDTLAASPLTRSMDDVQKHLQILKGASRLMFIAHALEHSWQHALECAPEILLIDGHIYKYAVMEQVLGLPAHRAWEVLTLFPETETVFLQVTPERAKARKSNPSTYEGGPRFLEVQRQAAKYWEELLMQNRNWRVIDTEIRSPAEIVKTVLSEVLR